MKSITRCIISCILLSGFTPGVYAQTASMNYIHSFDVQLPGITNAASLDLKTPATTALQTIQYYDGLGRTVQTVQKGITPEGYDLIKPIKYNGVGLDEINYEPYCDNISSGEYRSNVATAQPAFYLQQYGDSNGKSPVEYEKSPFPRVLKQGSPGAPWQLDVTAGGHPIRFSYLYNSTSDPKLDAVLWKVVGNTCIKAGNYAMNQLLVTRTLDEDGTESYEFRDKQGQVILKRSVLDDETRADTYYVYDDFGLLRFVISPEGSARISGDFDASHDMAAKYVYSYTYDARNRMVEKQIPGKAPEYYVYNKCDQLIMHQDGNMRKLKNDSPAYEWMFTRYDALGRVVMTGITTEFSSLTREAVQFLANGDAYKCWEFVLPLFSLPASDNNYYTNQSFPMFKPNYCSLMTLNYYDSYKVCFSGSTESIPLLNNANLAPSPPSCSDPICQPESGLVAGKATVGFVNYNEVMLASALYYDVLGRVIQTRSQNHANGYDIFTSQYQGLTANILKTEHRHRTTFSGNTMNLLEQTAYTYDAAGRPTTYTYRYNDTGPDRIIIYTYDALGQLKAKQLKDDTRSLQTIDYTYNIRGWLTKINDPAIVSATGDLFGLELLYNNRQVDLSNTPAFNGNISGAIWQTAQPYGISTTVTTGLKAYTYAYDKLNRLLSGKFAEAAGSSWEFNDKYSELTAGCSMGTECKPYDLNGNILKMKRYGLRQPNNNPGTIDELTYTYDGNKLIAVDDAVSNNNGSDFADNGQNYDLTHSPEYAYDKNGNLIKDSNKGILNITYNYLNQPVSIAKAGNMRVEYLYDAAGVKRQQTYYAAVEGIVSTTTDFVGNFVYENHLPAWVVCDEGRVVLNSNGSAYCNEAYIKDHLGNVRIACHLENGVVKTRQADSYYPFGMTLKGLTANSSDSWRGNEYLYNGKMLQDEMGLNWLDYGARFYDPVLGNWLASDPLAETNPKWNPYNYCRSNPINFVDPDGMDDTDIYGRKKYDDFSGMYIPPYDRTLVSGDVEQTRNKDQASEGDGDPPKDSKNNSKKAEVTRVNGDGYGNTFTERLLNLPRALWNGYFFRTNLKIVKIDIATNPVFWVVGGSISGSAKVGRVFWSSGGNIAVKVAAREFAIKNGMKTLEMTNTGKILQGLTNTTSYAFTKPFWEWASSNFARGANGPVTVFQNIGGIGVESIWGKIEYPILKSKQTEIIYQFVP